MAPEMTHPEMFGFTGEYRKRLPSRDTDTYALGITILEVSGSASPPPYIEIWYDSLSRLSQGFVHSTVSPLIWPFRSRFFKETDQTDHLQGSLTSCGSCW
jgi:hypothetical protein